MDFANTTQSARIIINMIVGIQGKKKKSRSDGSSSVERSGPFLVCNDPVSLG